MSLYEQEYVNGVYDKIAEHFSKTRSGKTWGKITEFINSLDKNSLVADIGCGNGKNMMIRNDCCFIGCDKTTAFVNICKKKNLNVILGDNLLLPFRDNMFDAVISVAVIHHFSTHERREQAVKELYRILKPNGKLYIQVWSNIQNGVMYDVQDTIIPWKLREGNREEIYNRYYHLFIKGELEELVKKYCELEIEESGEEYCNWYIIGRK